MVVVVSAYFAGFLSRVIFIGAMASLPYILRDPGVGFRSKQTTTELQARQLSIKIFDWAE